MVMVFMIREGGSLIMVMINNQRVDDLHHHDIIMVGSGNKER